MVYGSVGLSVFCVLFLTISIRLDENYFTQSRIQRNGNSLLLLGSFNCDLHDFFAWFLLRAAILHFLAHGCLNTLIQCSPSTRLLSPGYVFQLYVTQLPLELLSFLVLFNRAFLIIATISFYSTFQIGLFSQVEI